VTRPPRRRPEVTLAVLVGLLTVVLAPSLLPTIAAADTSDAPDEAILVQRGGEVYQANCAACHGTRGEGGPGPGVLLGPPVDSVDIRFIDQTVRTGRMPIAAPSVGVWAESLDEVDREALIAYARDRWDLPGEIPTVVPGDAARGQELYVRNCAACHGAAADGGISGAQAWVPPLVGIDGIAIAEATRIGPFEMPAFDPAVISDEDIDDIVGYLEAVAATPRTLAGVREVDQTYSGLYALGLGAAAMVVVLVVARARRWYLHEPTGVRTAPPFEPRR
jgi:ubiquinol-cytochrome c reductase cytochrome c subunit